MYKMLPQTLSTIITPLDDFKLYISDLDNLNPTDVYKSLPYYIPGISNRLNASKKKYYNESAYIYILYILSGFYGKRCREYFLQHGYINYGIYKKKIYNFRPNYVDKYDDKLRFFNYTGISDIHIMSLMMLNQDNIV